MSPEQVRAARSWLRWTQAELADLGVRRISVGGALARTAWGAFMKAAREIADSGSFFGMAQAVPHGEINGFFSKAIKERK